MTRKQKSERANERRKFFNSNKPHCPKCGSLLVNNKCPLAACPK